MDLIPEMVATLHKSVTDIVAAAPDKRDELLATSFAEFEAALKPELEKAVAAQTEEALEKRAEEEEEPLYKGLGTVGRVANLMSTLANQVRNITEGNPDDPEADIASDDVADLLDHMVGVGELALRAAVNEHVDIAGPDEDVDEDLNYVTVPNAEDPSDEASLVIKTALPTDLAKFACDPAALTMAAVELGSGLLLDCGVPQETLAKLFDVASDGPDVLAKDAGVAPAAAGPDTAEVADTGDFTSQLEILGRIMAAGLMQVDHLMQLSGDAGAGGGSMDGTADLGDVDPDAAAGAADPDVDPDADPDADPAKSRGDLREEAGEEDEDEAKKKKFGKSADGAGDAPLHATERAELEKLRGEVGSMSQQLQKMGDQVTPELEQLRKQIQRLSAQAAPPKAMLAISSLSKVDDGAMHPAGADEPLAKLAAEFDAARGETARNEVLLKAAIKYPGVDLSALRKSA